MPSSLAASLPGLATLKHKRSALDARLDLVGVEGMACELDACWTEASVGGASARAASVAIASWLFARRDDPRRAALAIAASDGEWPLAAALLGRSEPRRRLPRLAWRAEQRLASYVVLTSDRRRDRRQRLWPSWPAQRSGAVSIHGGRLAEMLRLLDEAALAPRTAIAMAAQRPLAGEVVAALTSHERWWAEQSVRDALLANPFTPADLVLSLLPVAPRRELVELVRGERLSSGVARGARAVLEARRGGERSMAGEPLTASRDRR